MKVMEIPNVNLNTPNVYSYVDLIYSSILRDEASVNNCANLSFTLKNNDKKYERYEIIH